MRTTLTLDDDVAAKVRQRCRRTGLPFKTVINEVLRLGLNAEQTLTPRQAFQIQARSLGLRPGIRLDNVAELLEQVEGPVYK